MAVAPHYFFPPPSGARQTPSNAFGWLHGSSAYFLGCESLANAWLGQGQPDRAMQVLEDAARQKNRTVQGSGAFWLRVVWQLAKTYRQAGRPADALKWEDELRRLLAVADSDHPIVIEMQRAGVRTVAP